MTADQALMVAVKFDRITLCLDFLAGVDDADLQAVLSDKKRLGHLQRDIRVSATFVRLMNCETDDVDAATRQTSAGG